MIIPLLAGLAVFGSVGLLVFLAFSTTESKLAGRASLRAIESYSWKGDDLIGTEKSLVDRVFLPLNKKLIALGRRFTPVGYVDNCRLKLQHAGRRGPDELDRFLAIRALTVGLVPLLGIGVTFLPLDTKMSLMTFGLLAFVLLAGPDAKLNQQVSARQRKVRRQLPDILDLLTISVEAGLGFEQAIDRIVATVPGPLSDEFNRMMGEMRAGAARADALQALETRTGVDEVKSFVMSMVQADTFGVSIGRVLRAQADEMRIKRRQLAQEQAQKAPVKMLLPMTFFIFPPLFTVVLGPALMNIAQNL